MNQISAKETYRQGEVLLVGANGFLGKVVLGLFLERYPEVQHLHVVMRGKGRLSPARRFQEDVLASPPLRAIAERRGQAYLDSRITVWGGDVSQERCGLSPEAVERMRGRVKLIINCAGLVEFLPPVDDAFRSNVDGVERLIELTKELNAKLLHVSTCFVCGECDGLVEETEPILGFFPRREGPEDHRFRHDEEIRYTREKIRQIYESAQATPGAPRSKELSQRLVDLGRQRAERWGWVNVYTYSKSLGEQLLAAENELEYAIVRPAIVEAAVRFPFPGWVEGGRTAAPLVMMAMSGLRHWTLRRDAPLEVVPVDLVAASILAVGAALMEGKHRRVYHISTADRNPLVLGPLVNWLFRECRRRRRESRRGLAKLVSLAELPLRAHVLTEERARRRRVRLERRIRRAREAVQALRQILTRFGLPGKTAIQNAARLLRLLELQGMVREQTLELYKPFMLRNRFIFEAENIRATYGLLQDEDRRLLPWDPEAIDWRDYWVNQEIAGIMKWVAPEVQKEFSFKM